MDTPEEMMQSDEKTMGNLYDINSTCLRYSVPSKYSWTFDDVLLKCKHNKQGEYKKFWERRKSTLDGPESNLYGYIRNEYRLDSDTEPLAEQKTGYEWLFWNIVEAEGEKVKELLYFPYAIKKDSSELPKA